MKLARMIAALAIMASPAFAQDTWTTDRAPLPRARAFHASATLGEKVYVFAGQSLPVEFEDWTHSMDEYNPTTNSWRSRAGITGIPGITLAASPGWQYPAGVALGGFIYQIGGTAHWLAGGTYLSIAGGYSFRYDPAADTWTPIATLSTASQQMRAVVLGSKIYALETNGAKLHEYDPSNNTWTQKSSYPESSSTGITMGVLQGKIFVAGGSTGGIGRSSYEYDPATGTWAARPAMPERAANAAYAAQGSRLWSFGGSVIPATGEFGASTLYEYSADSQTWAARATIPAVARFASAALRTTEDGTFIHLTGGQESWEANYTNHFIYSPIVLPKPDGPSGLFMNEPGGSALAEGDWTGRTTVEFGAIIQNPRATTARVQVEIVPATAPFTGTATATGTAVADGASIATFAGLTEGAWKWRCRVINGNDEVNDGGWTIFGSDAADLNVDTSAPGAPSPIGPGADFSVYERHGGNVTFDWTRPTDLAPRPLDYEVQVSRDGFNSIEAGGTVSGVESATFYVTASVADLAWRVRATDLGGRTGPWSAPMPFRVVFRDLINHAAGDAQRVCGFSATPGSCLWLLPLVLVIFRRARKD